MAICNPSDLKAKLPAGARLMGLDVGTKTIGLALSDTRLVVASPLRTINRKRFRDDATELFAEIAKHQVGALVVGLPISLDGTEGPRCQSVRQFSKNVLELQEIPIAFWDERLSTAAVTRGMLEADLSRKRRAEIVDKAAAAYILQGLLDRLSHLDVVACDPSAPTL